MNNLISLLDSVLPIVETWNAETSAQKEWKEKWLRQAREVVDKPKEYCSCIGLRINNANDKNCLRCGKPIKTEKIEPIKVILKPDHFQEDTEYMPVDENIEQLTNMINILIHRFNERG